MPAFYKPPACGTFFFFFNSSCNGVRQSHTRSLRGGNELIDLLFKKESASRRCRNSPCSIQAREPGKLTPDAWGRAWVHAPGAQMKNTAS